MLSRIRKWLAKSFLQGGEFAERPADPPPPRLKRNGENGHWYPPEPSRMDQMFPGLAPFQPPHCDWRVLHAPGECKYCDKLPTWQQARITDGIAFDSLNANGWSGNVAVKEGQLHTHMGVTYRA